MLLCFHLSFCSSYAAAAGKEVVGRRGSVILALCRFRALPPSSSDAMRRQKLEFKRRRREARYSGTERRWRQIDACELFRTEGERDSEGAEVKLRCKESRGCKGKAAAAAAAESGGKGCSSLCVSACLAASVAGNKGGTPVSDAEA